jgi:hypothetical protein
MPIVEECKKVWQQNIEQDAFLVASFERNTRSILKRCHTWIPGGVMVMKAMHAEVVAKSEHRHVCQFEQVFFERVL